jgi:hypothetical protein
VKADERRHAGRSNYFVKLTQQTRDFVEFAIDRDAQSLERPSRRIDAPCPSQPDRFDDSPSKVDRRI